MYFPFLKLHGWGKRLAIWPQMIYSEVPLYFLPEDGIILI